MPFTTYLPVGCLREGTVTSDRKSARNRYIRSPGNILVFYNILMFSFFRSITKTGLHATAPQVTAPGELKTIDPERQCWADVFPLKRRRPPFKGFRGNETGYEPALFSNPQCFCEPNRRSRVRPPIDASIPGQDQATGLDATTPHNIAALRGRDRETCCQPRRRDNKHVDW